MQTSSIFSRRPTKRRIPIVIIIAGFCVLISVIVWAALFWLKQQIIQTGFTTESTAYQYSIGRDKLNIPANMMRFERQRINANPEQIDLAVLWPSGSGYSLDKKAEFEKTDISRKVLFLTLEKRGMTFDMSDRLIPIYTTLFSGPPKQTEYGLVFQGLKSGSGYDGEILAVSQTPLPGRKEFWVARCQRANSTVDPVCLRDIFVGNNLSLRYRFPLQLLQNWREIEQLILKKTAHMIANR